MRSKERATISLKCKMAIHRNVSPGEEGQSEGKTMLFERSLYG